MCKKAVPVLKSIKHFVKAELDEGCPSQLADYVDPRNVRLPILVHLRQGGVGRFRDFGSEQRVQGIAAHLDRMDQLVGQDPSWVKGLDAADILSDSPALPV